MQNPNEDAAGAEQRRSPGGNALIRLLEHRQARGYARLSSAAIGTATRAIVTAMKQSAPPAEGLPPWRSIGPATIVNGQTSDSSTRMNVSGRVAAIAVDPSDPAHVLCGAANGGVWESCDRGSTWAPRTDNATNLSVGALAFDPSNPSVVYCGTGEGNWWGITGVGSFGILRSTDGGSSWTSLCEEPFLGQAFFDLLVDPGDSNHLLAATTEGLYVSNDGGLTWTRGRTVRTWSISISPPSGAMSEILAASRDGLWSSSDGGTSWSPVALDTHPGPFAGATGATDELAGRLAVSIAASNPSVAYAWGANKGSTTRYLWRRSDGIWTAITDLPPEIIDKSGKPLDETGQCWYDWYVAAPPDIDTEVYCGAIHCYRGNLSGSTWTWVLLNIHTDHHAIAFEPGNASTIYAGSDGGLFRSPDRGVTWQHCNNGLVISQFEYLAQNVGSPQWLIAGLQDNGVVRWTGSQEWEHVADGDGGFCCVHQDDPQIVLRTDHFWRVELSNTGGDFGSWSRIYPNDPPDRNCLFYPPMRFNEGTGATVAIGGDVVYVSKANGSAWMWTKIALPVSSGELVSAIFLPNPNNVYAGTTNGQLFHIAGNRSGWSVLPALITPRTNAWVSDVMVDPSNTNRMWVTYSTMGGGRVYRSDDGGSTWTDCTAGLPGLPVNAIEVDSRDQDRLWVALDCGVFQSRDGGAQWTNFANGLPNVYVGDLLFHPQAFLLRAATRDRGVWEIAVDGP